MSLDPWRTLGLAPGAGEAEIKRAYRRLAKEHHPDAGGSAALPRFLAIQAAYEMLISGRIRGAAHRSGTTFGGRRGHEGAPSGGQPWSADPARARATREAWGRAGGRRRWAGQGAAEGPARGSGDRGGPASAGRPADGASGETGAAGEAGGRPGGSGNPAGNRQGSRGGPRTQRIRKATPGSTTYDEAHLEPAEPDWTGSSWYGQASGTYWTINPREYADPRKHGPDYQARARRANRDGGAPGGDRSTPSGAGVRSTNGHAAPGSAARMGTAAPAAATPGPPGGAGTARDPWRGTPPASEAPHAPAGTPGPSRGAGGSIGPDRPTAPGPTGHREPRGLLAPLVGRIVGIPIRPASRMGLALAAWPPLGVAALLIQGELTGCARAAATCPGSAQLAASTLILQVVILASLIAAPSLARIGAVGTLGSLVAAVPGVALLTALGATYAPDGGPAALLWLLGLAWLAGAAVGWSRLRRGEPTHREDGGRVGSPT